MRSITWLRSIKFIKTGEGLMGSGSHVAQVAERSYGGEMLRERHSLPCAEEVVKRYEIGDYVVLGSERGFLVMRGDRVIGSFPEGRVLEDEGRALFKLDKGMLFEITSEGCRQIFTREKAGLHGAICADGHLRCGGYWEKYRGNGDGTISMISS
ncbi:TPA: hypothetical protein EYP44_00430 [Candidatus Bathyarchaeota archaeon]|nr:hypothetical protein [Candidatus Bathyarchaeota archaeon]